MNVPAWIKLAAASREELLEEVLNTIEEMGGIDKAQEALRQSNKKANWVMREKFVVSKTVTDIGRELGQRALKEREEVKPINPSHEKEKDNPEIPSAEVSEEPKEDNQFQDPPTEVDSPAKEKEKMSQGSYLATLLAMFLAGVGGTLGAQQLANLDLRRELVKVVDSEQGLNNQVSQRLRNMLEDKPDLPKVDVSKEVEKGMAYQHNVQLPGDITPAENIEDQLPQEGDEVEYPKEIQPKRTPYKGKRELRKEKKSIGDNPEEPQ